MASGPKVIITLRILSAQIEKIFVELDHPRSLGLGGHYKISEAVCWSAAAETVLTILTRIHESSRWLQTGKCFKTFFGKMGDLRKAQRAVQF